jgi:hypothetical protein
MSAGINTDTTDSKVLTVGAHTNAMNMCAVAVRDRAPEDEVIAYAGGTKIGNRYTAVRRHIGYRHLWPAPS